MNNPDIVRERLEHAQRIWSLADQNLPAIDVRSAVDPSFVLALGNDSSLKSSKLPINSTFIMAGEPPYPKLEGPVEERAKLHCQDFNFLPDSYILTTDAKGLLIDCAVPVLRESRLYLRITGSAAWPGPPGRYSESQIKQFAQGRALAIAEFLAQPPQNIDPNRFIIADALLPPQDRREITSESDMQKDRFVRLELVSPAGR